MDSEKGLGYKLNQFLFNWFLLVLLVAGITAVFAQTDTTGYYSYENQLDINNAELEDIAQLPVSQDIAEALYDRVTYRGAFQNIYQLREVEGIDQKLLNKLKPLIRIEPYRKLSATQEKIEQIYYRLDRWSSNEGVNDAFIDLWIEKALDPMNVNTVRYDELMNLQNVSPVDVVSIIHHREDAGEIRNTRDLRGVPGLSYYGYSNARNFLDYTDPEVTGVPFHGHFTMRLDNTPFMTEEGEASGEAMQQENIYPTGTRTSNDYNALPNMYYKTRFSVANYYKFGFSYTRYLNEPDVYLNENSSFKIPDMKFFAGLENLQFGDFQLRKLYVGNYSATFGQGVIMENTDFFTPRKSGYGFRKRFNGITGDNSRTREFSLRGIATEMAWKNISATVFGSYTDRDAILNRTVEDSSLGRSFNQFIILDQRFKYALDDGVRRDSSLSWLNSVKELTYGSHFQYDFMPGTWLGLTYYESAYDRYLNPDPEEITADTEWQNRQVTADTEIKQAYGGPVSRGENPFWDDAISFRRIYGFDFQTVIKNVAIQGEWGELDKGGSVFKMGDDPKALVLSAYVQFPSLNILALYRNYDLGYDNPFQRSFSNYRRFKGTIFEDYYYLQSSLYGQLYANAAQPQAEEGYYLNTYYQMTRQITMRMEYDNWYRKADRAEHYRLVGTVDYRPIFPVRIQLRQKWQAREEQNDVTLNYYKNLEFRGRLRMRLSGYDDLSLMYVNTKLIVHPRPRVFGDMTVNGEAIAATFVHNFNPGLKLSGMLAYYKGFFWNFEDTQFTVLESTRGALRYWFSVYTRLNHYLSLRLKYTAELNKAINYIRFNDVRDEDPSKHYGTDWNRKNADFYYLELNYSF
ncbi:MAG: helix-hairpin-helix domain-containing protein [Calditrichaceae bacterium]